MLTPLFDAALADHQAVFAQLETLEATIEHTAGVMTEALYRGHKVMFCGNGGSACDAQHLAAELSGRFVNSRAPLAGLALAADAASLTCVGNDFGFEAVFERQVQALGRAGDCLVAISTSGHSPNVLRAVQAAKAVGITTIGLSGKGGGELPALCDHVLVVPSAVTARIQEAHIFIGHLWCSMIERNLGVGQSPDGSA